MARTEGDKTYPWCQHNNVNDICLDGGGIRISRRSLEKERVCQESWKAGGWMDGHQRQLRGWLGSDELLAFVSYVYDDFVLI